MNFNVKSSTARLLANENITVNQTNSNTAWFDVEKRVLNLPLWNVDPFIYDMLVGHEVGHALYTPADGWHKSIVDLNIPRSYVNVVEDARIEKLVKRKYPGIVYTFQRAYRWFHEEDFFKVRGKNLFTMKLIDRINMHFKLGSSMKVPFTSDELQFVEMVGKSETFEDVVAASKAILEYWKENKEKSLEELQEMMPNEDSGYGDDIYDNEDSEDDEGEYYYAPNEDGEDEEDVEGTVESSGAGVDTDNDNDEVSDTDDALRQNESKLLSTETGLLIKLYPEKYVDYCMIGYKQYYSVSRDSVRPILRGFSRWECEGDWEKSYIQFAKDEYKKFMTETNRAVGYMVKEFEQKKAAYQYSRAKVSSSGTLNTSALHKYKFSEDVFKRITTLADAKSHGMVISIDLSGSMGGVFMDTVKQALNLALFCNRVSIPFEMYGFTTDNPHYYDHTNDTSDLMDGCIYPGNMKMVQYFSSKMKKAEFNNAMQQMFLSACGITNIYDEMGSTPTNETLVALKYIIERFRKNTGVQKMINIVLTDGDPNSTAVVGGNSGGSS